MNCERARELFSDYLEGSMDAALAAVIRGHLQKCPDCAREFEGFRATWGTLGAFAEIEPPRDFRHDVVMRAVRLQQEREQAAKRNTPAINWDQIFGRLIPVRPFAIVAAAAALAFVALRFPQQAYQQFTGMLSPKAGISQPVRSYQKSNDSSVSKSNEQMQAWQSRKLGRNTVWVSVAPRESNDGSSVTLSINRSAFAPNEVSESVPARVYVLPANEFSFSDMDTSAAVWSGNILDNSSVVVPCVNDDSSEGAGTINLLITWEYEHRQFGYVVLVPTRKGGIAQDFSASGRDIANSQTNMYAALHGIAEDFGVPVIACANLTETPGIINLGRESLKSALTQMLSSTGVKWMYADGAVYVDH